MHSDRNTAHIFADADNTKHLRTRHNVYKMCACRSMAWIFVAATFHIRLELSLCVNVLIVSLRKMYSWLALICCAVLCCIHAHLITQYYRYYYIHNNFMANAVLHSWLALAAVASEILLRWADGQESHHHCCRCCFYGRLHYASCSPLLLPNHTVGHCVPSTHSKSHF